MPPPTSQPLLVLLLERVIDAPVTVLVMVRSSEPTQPPPAFVVYIAEVQAEESVGQITLAPGSAEVGADVESSPTERLNHIDRRRRIDRRARANVSGVRNYRKCQQRRHGGGRLEQSAHVSPPMAWITP